MRRAVRISTIRDVQDDLEESLASLYGLALPPELEGLRHLPIGDHDPRVSIRRVDSRRKVREDAAASYFHPDMCEVVISFVPSETDRVADDRPKGLLKSPQRRPPTSSTLTRQRVSSSTRSGRQRSCGRLWAWKWFRDQFLPRSGYDWALDHRMRAALLRHATDERLVLTSHVPNPNQPLHPVTAIRVNRRHSRFQSAASHRITAFTPIVIRGGPISDTVLSDRR